MSGAGAGNGRRMFEQPPERASDTCGGGHLPRGSSCWAAHPSSCHRSESAAGVSPTHPFPGTNEPGVCERRGHCTSDETLEGILDSMA